MIQGFIPNRQLNLAVLARWRRHTPLFPTGRSQRVQGHSQVYKVNSGTVRTVRQTLSQNKNTWQCHPHSTGLGDNKVSRGLIDGFIAVEARQCVAGKGLSKTLSGTQQEPETFGSIFPKYDTTPPFWKCISCVLKACKFYRSIRLP